MAFQNLKDLIPHAAAKYQNKLPKELTASLVISRATSIIHEFFEEPIIDSIRAKRFTDGVLWIGVKNSVVAQEFQDQLYEFHEQLNNSFGKTLIQKVRIFQDTNTFFEEENQGLDTF